MSCLSQSELTFPVDVNTNTLPQSSLAQEESMHYLYLDPLIGECVTLKIILQAQLKSCNLLPSSG